MAIETRIANLGTKLGIEVTKALGIDQAWSQGGAGLGCGWAGAAGSL